MYNTKSTKQVSQINLAPRFFKPSNQEKWEAGRACYWDNYGPESIWHVTSWRLSTAYYLFNGDKELGIPSYADDREAMSQELAKVLSRNKNIQFANLIGECRKQCFAGYENYLAKRKEPSKTSVTEDQRLRWRLANEKSENEAILRIWKVIDYFRKTLKLITVSINVIAKKAGAHWLTARKVMKLWSENEEQERLSREKRDADFSLAAGSSIENVGLLNYSQGPILLATSESKVAKRTHYSIEEPCQEIQKPPEIQKITPVGDGLKMLSDIFFGSLKPSVPVAKKLDRTQLNEGEDRELFRRNQEKVEQLRKLDLVERKQTPKRSRLAEIIQKQESGTLEGI